MSTPNTKPAHATATTAARPPNSHDHELQLEYKSRALVATVSDDPAMTTSQIWELHHEGRAVARLHVAEADFPRLSATVERCGGYEHVEPLVRRSCAT